MVSDLVGLDTDIYIQMSDFLSPMYPKALILVSSFTFANKTSQICCRDLFYPAFCFFIPPVCSSWLELAAALPVPRRQSYKANDAGRGFIHFRKMSNKVLRKWNWLENVAVHYYLEWRGERQVCQFLAFKCHSCLFHGVLC